MAALIRFVGAACGVGFYRFLGPLAKLSKKKELGEKILILRQGFCKVTGQHFGILVKCPYHEVDFTTDRV